MPPRTKAEQNKIWRDQVDLRREVRVEPERMHLIDNDWRRYSEFIPKLCSTGQRGGREMRATDEHYAVLSKGRYRRDEYACTEMSEICTDESQNPTGYGTRHDPPIVVAGRAYSPDRAESRHTTRLMPPRIALRGIGDP
jgi:hypothetical protein